MARVKLLVGALVLLALAGCDTDEESRPPAGPPPSSVVHLSAEAIGTAGIRTAPVERRRLERVIELTGTLAAVPWNAEEQAAVSDAESADADRRLKATSYARQARLAAEGIVSRQTLDAARAELDAARAIAATADAALANLGLGTHARSLGAHVRIWGLAILPESELAEVRAGAALDVTTSAYPGRAFKGRVVEVSRSSDPAIHAFTLRIAIDDRERLLRPHMLATFRVVSRLPPALVVPRSALLLEGDGTWSYVATDGGFRRTAVTTGAASPTEIEIVSGLSAGDQVVVAGAQLLESERLKSTLRISD
jgi:hypothetical protein